MIYEGIRLLKVGKFKEAIPKIEETIGYYTLRAWIDKYRFLLLISSAKRSIRETAICNLAYCYLQLGDIKKAKKIYEEVLNEFPENTNAKTMLNTISIIADSAQPYQHQSNN